MLMLLVRASLEGALLAACIWVVCRALPRLSPSVRAILWWCVAAKFVVAMLWLTPIRLPVLPAALPAAVPPVALPMRPADRNVAAVVPAPLSDTQRNGGPSSSTFPWTTLLVSVWGLGVGVSLWRTRRAWQQTRAVVSRSLPGDERLHAEVRSLSSLLGLRRTADVRLSSEVESPMITGVRSPVILVPAIGFPSLMPEQQRMALCHELAHMKRGDVWLGCIPAAVERCFFFHPLARLAAREYAFWREAACDEAVITTLGVSPQSYGRLLLALGVSRPVATFSAAGAAWSFSNLKRRITMLDRSTSVSYGARVLAASAVALTVLALAPVKAVARSAAPTAAAPAEAAFYPTPLGVSETPELVTGSTDDGVSNVGESEVAPKAVPVQERRRQDELRFVYFSDDRSTTMSGSSGDMSRARRQRRSGERLLWFMRDGEEYVVRDTRTLREVEELWAPVSEIGEEQGKIGSKQGEIGAEQGRQGALQGAVGAKQGLVGARQGVIGAQLGVLAAREAAGASASERRDIEREREELERAMRALDREMRALSEEMRDVAPPSRGMSEDMEKLGRDMSVLGEQMEVASKRANAGMRTLIDRAIRSGAAEVVR
ncbi:MAG TPA: M56 family metallopeptidase [Gemmatimonas sp.]|nr:M56 family metallopeptidase [Gemmatimonas sp.]